ncbi:MAG: extracellular solute-binding protein [Alphaproteobacteria bacterium]|nr:extracellular solute-binding protein [Alphaproteobacteria bacterium]
MMNKSLLTTSTFLAAVGIFGQLAPAAGADQTVTFRSWSPIVETTEKMIAATEAAHPGIKIESQIFNYPDYIVDLQTRATGGSVPDLIGLEPGALTQQYRDFLAPAQDCAASVWGDDWQSKFFPLAVDQLRLGNPDGDENYYGLPVLTQTINLWYTIPVLEDAGLEPPKTYDELKVLAETVGPAGTAPLMVGATDGWLRRDVYMQLIHNVAPGLIYEAELGQANFTDAPFVEAMTWWKRLFDDQIIQPGALGLSAYPGSMELIEAGRAALFPMGAWWQQQATRPNPPPLSKGLSGFAPVRFPDVTGKGEPPEDLLGGIDVMIGITKDAKDPEAACKVLTDWIGGAGAQELINTFNDLPAFIGLTPASFETENQKAVWDLFTEEWLPTVKYARQLRDPAVKQGLEDALAAVAAGDKTPEEGMQMVQDAYDSISK